MRTQLLKIILFIAVLLWASFVYDWLAEPAALPVTPQNAACDLSGYDFDHDTVYVRSRNWAYYGGVYHTPEDFARGEPGAPVIEDTASAPDEYGTHRVTLRLPAGRTYGIYGWSFLTAQRLYINGKLALEVGSPGQTKETTAPRTQFYFFAFEPQTDVTELVFHVANFHTGDGAGRYAFYIGGFETVFRGIYRSAFATCLMAGCLLAAFLFFAGMFLFMPGKRSFLCFALICLLIAVRTLLAGEKPLMQLFPGLGWGAGYAAEYLSITMLLAVFTLYLGALYPRLLPRLYSGACIGVCALYAVVVLLTEPSFYAPFLPYFTVFWVLCAAFDLALLTGRFLRTRPRQLSDVLLLAGFYMILAGAASDALYHFFRIGLAGPMLQRATILCVLIHMVALALDFSRSELELLSARLAEREMAETNQALDRLNRMKNRFIADISHELKTPLTVMSVNAQLTKAKLEAGQSGEDTGARLDTISTEARRLGRMVEELLRIGAARETGELAEAVPLGDVLRNTARLFQPLAERRGNRLIAQIPEALPRALGNADMLTQVLVNLLANANEHTKNGEIRVAAASAGGVLTFTVSDTGEGIPADILPHVFERQVTDGSGAGLGLALCKGIVEQFGGTITMKSEPSRGAVVRVTLPVIKEDGHGQASDGTAGGGQRGDLDGQP